MSNNSAITFIATSNITVQKNVDSFESTMFSEKVYPLGINQASLPYIPGAFPMSPLPNFNPMSVLGANVENNISGSLQVFGFTNLTDGVPPPISGGV